ncbi:MAG: SIS domain-containing protein [Bacteroidota bacterium]
MNISEYRQKYDTQSVYDLLLSAFSQIEYSWEEELPELFEQLTRKYMNGYFSNIVYSAIGDSATAGEILWDYLADELEVPFLVNRDYQLPAYVNESSFLILASNSGNSEELVSVFNEALERNCTIVALSSGGKIQLMAEDLEIPFFRLKGGMKSRFAVYQLVFAVLRILQKTGFISDQDETVDRLISLLKIKGEEYSWENNIALSYAESLKNAQIAIFSAISTSGAARRMKDLFNQCAKVNCAACTIPDADYNEIAARENSGKSKTGYRIINILDETYHPSVKTRFETAGNILRKYSLAEPVVLVSGEETFRERLFDIIYLGDWISYYLSIITEKNPASSDNIKLPKEQLGKK